MFETERLFLRPLTKNDVEAVFKMRSDKNVMRFIRPLQTECKEAENWINLVSSLWKSDKIGFCAVIEKQTQKFIGWCGLWRLKESGEIEVGYALSPEFQQKGYATEAAKAFLDYGFDELNLEKIVAVARPENDRSRRVMERLGMKYDGIGKFYGLDLAHYSITKDDYFRNRKIASPANHAG